MRSRIDIRSYFGSTVWTIWQQPGQHCLCRLYHLPFNTKQKAVTSSPLRPCLQVEEVSSSLGISGRKFPGESFRLKIFLLRQNPSEIHLEGIASTKIYARGRKQRFKKGVKAQIHLAPFYFPTQLVMFHFGCSAVMRRMVQPKWRVVRSGMEIRHTARKGIVIVLENCLREALQQWPSYREH